jgi:ferric-dicitrate binding protein FerR (iron transport regulator)
MMTTPKNKSTIPDTDAAWNTLHDRLRRDQLLDNVMRKSSTVRWQTSWRWVAAAFLALCVGSTLLLYVTHRPDNTKLLTVQNNESEGALVQTLEDGSTVYLAANTSLHYPLHFSGEKREVSLTGNAMFDIARNPQKPFVIETKNIQVEVLGTAFNIQTTADGRFQLSVLRGKVKVSDKTNGEMVFVKVGERVTMQGGHLYKTANPDLLLFSRYISNMHFKDEPLANVIRVINQNSVHPVVLKGEAIKQDKLNVRFYNNNMDSMTRIISLALHLKREVKQDTIFLYQ